RPRTEHPVRLRLHPGAALQPLLCRAPHPVGTGRCHTRLASWPLPAHLGGACQGVRHSRHRGSGKNVTRYFPLPLQGERARVRGECSSAPHVNELLRCASKLWILFPAIVPLTLTLSPHW